MSVAADISKKLAGARGWFEEWRTANDFADQLDAVLSNVKSEYYFNRNDAKWVQEAWILNQYARFSNPSKLRLNRNDPPDGFIEIADKFVPIEITEVVEPGRRRGLEYRPSAPRVVHDPVERWIERATVIPNALKERLQEKFSTQYDQGTELVVYLNISEWGIRQREIETDIQSILSESSGPFAAISVLWKEKLFSSNGRIVSMTDPTAIEDSSEDQEIWNSVWRGNGH